MRRLFMSLAVAAALLGAAAPAPAQDWPARPVRIIVPLAPGGGGDVFARLLGEELARRLGQPFVVENRPGGALNIGMRACAESPADGYTLCLTSSEPIVTNQFLYKSMPFNAETDFEAITLLFFNPIALVTNNTLGVKTIAELVALSKARPGTLSYATFSFPAMHFMDGLKKTADADWVYVPYRSGNEVVNAVVTGATPVAFLGLANMLGQLRSGLISGIALNAHARSPLFPNLPTLTEAGAEDFPPAWFGLFAPRGTPKPVLAKLHGEIVRITGEPAWRQKNFIDRAIEPAVNTPEQFAAFIVRERKIAERIVRENPASSRNDMIPRRIRLALIVAAFALATPAVAQDWPSRPVRIIIPLAPGGGGDVFTRALADELQKALGQPVLVENRPGGGLNIGTRACAEAVPDGTTLCVLSSEPLIYNQFLFKSIPYDPDKDLQPIVNMFFNVLALVINSDTKVKSIADLVTLARARPGTLSFGTFSFPLAHFMSKLNKTEGIDIVRVPFRGGGEVVNAVLGGTTPIALLALSNMLPQLQSGRITALAVNAKARSPLFPDVPTLSEARPGEDYPPTWFGLFTPAGVPRPIAERIASEVTRIVSRPDFRQRMFVERAVEPARETLDDFHRFIRAERKISERLVRDSGEQPK